MIPCPMCKEEMNDFDKPDELTDRYFCCFCKILVTIKDISVDDMVDEICQGEE